MEHQILMHQHKFQTKTYKVTNLPRYASSDINQQQPGLVLNDLVFRCFNSSYLLEKRETEIVFLGMKHLLSQNTNITIHVKQLLKLIK